MSDPLSITQNIFRETFGSFGASSRGLDYNTETQHLDRIRALLQQVPSEDNLNVVDFGCGFGSMLDLLPEFGFHKFSYTGCDIVPEMIEHAKLRWIGRADQSISFVTGDAGNCPSADYILGSGVFNKKMKLDENDWEEYVFENLDYLLSKTKRKLIFNFLTSYSDAEFQREDLYYADPTKFLGWALLKTRNARIIHDYGLYDFTLVVSV